MLLYNAAKILCRCVLPGIGGSEIVQHDDETGIGIFQLRVKHYCPEHFQDVSAFIVDQAGIGFSVVFAELWIQPNGSRVDRAVTSRSF